MNLCVLCKRMSMVAMVPPLCRSPNTSHQRCREDFDTILDITKCKTKSTWGADPMQGVETKVKSAFTRSFNKAGLPVRCTIMVEDGKKSKGKKAAPPPVDTGDDAPGGEIAEVRLSLAGGVSSSCQPPAASYVQAEVWAAVYKLWWAH